MEPGAFHNPFPGLRTFEPDENHLFFGREKQTDDLLRRLRTNRFLVVTGSSGSGKSSLVRSGLVPSLYGGFMAATGSDWRIAILRPGDSPIANLAAALATVEVLTDETDSNARDRLLLEVTLRRSALGLIEAVREARIPDGENILVVVDQFEELFRFRNSQNIQNSKDEASAFVKLLLEAAQQTAVPIYVVLTMRADFIGDCMNFPGLPEAVNAGQYLVPRMTRNQLRSAINGPIAVSGGSIAPRLVARLLNDCGDDPDQLPVLQHALMRTWSFWAAHRTPGEPVDIAHYEAIGTIRQALSLHAEEAFEEACALAGPRASERLFKALTDTSAETKGVRRPTSVEELLAICEVPEADLISTIEVFRGPAKSFLMPPPSQPLSSSSVIDLSHESLMRCWTRLVAWTNEEKASADYYSLLAQAAQAFEDGTGGLWRDPELEFGLRWRNKNQPSAAWAQRIAPEFDHAMRFLGRSAQERDRLKAETRRQRTLKWAFAWSAIGILSLLSAVAFYQWRQARTNLNLAKDTVDSLLSSTASQSSQIAAESPDVEEFRKQFVEQAKTTYGKIVAQNRGKEFTEQIALVDLRLGDGYRITGRTDQAIRYYEAAIAQLQRLSDGSPANFKYRRELADAYNWLGETQRPIANLRSEADRAYNSALQIQREIHATFPHDSDAQLALARTYYNRGILQKSEPDYRRAIELLTPLAAGRAETASRYRQELARAKNNLAELLFYANLPGNPDVLFNDAIGIAESLLQKKPDNRDYKFELAQYYNNAATFLQSQGHLDSALALNKKALGLLDELAQPMPTWTMHLGLSHDIRAQIMELKNSSEAEAEYRESIDAFRRLPPSAQTSESRLWFGQALANMGSWYEQKKDYKSALPLLLEARAMHRQVRSDFDLAWDYCYLGTAYKGLKEKPDLQNSAKSLSEAIPRVNASDRPALQECLHDLNSF